MWGSFQKLWRTVPRGAGPRYEPQASEGCAGCSYGHCDVQYPEEPAHGTSRRPQRDVQGVPMDTVTCSTPSTPRSRPTVRAAGLRGVCGETGHGSAAHWGFYSRQPEITANGCIRESPFPAFHVHSAGRKWIESSPVAVTKLGTVLPGIITLILRLNRDLQLRYPHGGGGSWHKTRNLL